MERINRVLDSLDVPIITIYSVSLSFTAIETAMKILALLIGAGYSAWKWYAEYKKYKESKNKSKNKKLEDKN